MDVDLDEDASPEDLMLSYVSGDKSKDRTDREVRTATYADRLSHPSPPPALRSMLLKQTDVRACHANVK